MQESEFANLVKSLRLFFGKKETSTEQVLAWYEVVQHVPGGEPLGWIEKQIKKNEKFFPTNLPRCILKYWQCWQEEHPTQVAPKSIEKESYGFCPDRCADGLWHVQKEKYDERLDVVNVKTSVFRCARCRQSDLHGIPFATKEQLEAMGWRIKGDQGLHHVTIEDWQRLLGKVPKFVAKNSECVFEGGRNDYII
jgi:hypothetical protein